MSRIHPMPHAVPVAIQHEARGSRRFRCPRCGRLHVWPTASRPGRTAEDREIRCPCGVRHWR